MRAVQSYRLIFLRHGESPSAVPDRARPLSKRGRLGMRSLAQALARLKWIPEHVLCSDARRCTESWSQLSPLTPTLKPEIHPALYLAPAERLLEHLETEIDEAKKTSLLLAHNPGLSVLGERLADAGSLAPGDALCLDCEATSWQSALHQRWRIAHRLNCTILLREEGEGITAPKRALEGPLATPVPIFHAPVKAARASADHNHQAQRQWVRVGVREEFSAPVNPWRGPHDGRDYLVVNDGTELRLFLDRCPHRGLSMARGAIVDGCLVCPFHQWQFRLEDGMHTFGSGVQLNAYPLEERGGELWAKLQNT